MKPIWRLIIITIATGAILSLTALSLGAAENGFYMDKTGVHVFTHGEKDLFRELSIGEVTDIDVDVSYSNVEFLSADQFGIEISGDYSQWTWKLENGALKIRHEESSKWFITSFNFSSEADHVKIYIPKDAVLGDVSIKTGSGAIKVGDFIADDVEIYNSYGKTDIYDIISDRIEVDMSSGKFTGTDLAAEKLEYKNSYGSGYLDTVVVGELIADTSSGNFELQDCTIEKVRMDNGFGNIDAKGLSTSKADINVSSGSVSLDGEFLGETVVTASFGNVKLFTSRPKEDYSYSIGASLGRIIFDNERMGSNTSIKSDSVSENNLKIKASSGDIEVYFGK